MSLERLVKRFERLPPREVLNQLTRRSRNEFLMLSVYSTLGSALFLRACQANPNITMVLGGARTNCGLVATQFAQTMQFVGAQGAWQNINNQRGQLLAMIKCSDGRANRASCGSYATALSNMNRMSHNTSMAIINNLPTGTCVVGRDPNCYH